MRTRIASFALSILLLVACDDSSTSSKDDPGTNQPPTGSDTGTKVGNSGSDFDLAYEFVALGANRAYVIQMDTSRYCDNDTLHTEIRIDTTEITMTSNDAISSDDDDTVVYNGSVYKQSVHLRRIGSGTGFQGTWSFNETLTPLPGVDPTNIEREYGKMSDSAWITVTSTKVVQHIVGFHYGMITGPMAQQFSSIPNVTMTYSSDSSQVVVSSPKTSEKITLKVTMGQDGPAMTFSSSNPAHGAITMGDDPTSCPDDRMPSWFSEFMAAAMGANTVSTSLPSLPKAPSRF